jgi:purine-nucleoside phosphorylase
MIHLSDYQQHAAEAAAYLARQGLTPVDAVLQCGSGLSGVVNELLDVEKRIELSGIPHLPVGDVAGHGNEAAYGQVGEAKLLVFTGRLHIYEGHAAATAGFPAAIAKETGARLLICTNAAGALNEDLRIGDVMVHQSYINHQGDNAAACLEFENSAQRFVNPDPPYDMAASLALARHLAKAGMTVRHGTYIAVRGPVFETDAELRMMRGWGADAIGMSTVPEVITCHILNLPVAGLSVLTNLCLDGSQTTHAGVLSASRAAAPRLAQALRTMFEEGQWCG